MIKSINFRIVYLIYECIGIFNYRRIAVCNCNCQHHRTKFYFGFWCLNKVIIIKSLVLSYVCENCRPTMNADTDLSLQELDCTQI